MKERLLVSAHFDRSGIKEGEQAGERSVHLRRKPQKIPVLAKPQLVTAEPLPHELLAVTITARLTGLSPVLSRRHAWLCPHQQGEHWRASPTDPR